MCGYNVFLSQKQQEDKTLITKKKMAFIFCAQDSQWATNTGQKFFVGLSLHSMDYALVNLPLFGSSQVRSSTGSNHA